MNHDLKTYLETRRSVPAKMLGAPGPDRDTISAMLTMASRVPDHGKLAPWRYIVISGDARDRLSDKLGAIAMAKDPDLEGERLEQEKTRLNRAPVVIAVVSCAGPHPKIPEWEQVLSAGAACTVLYMAANAFGYACNWLSEWMAYDREALDLIGVGERERVAGFLHIGTSTVVPVDRPRPDVEAITTWLD